MATFEGAESGRRAVSKPYECPECGIRLTRPSHLARHVHSHLPASQRSLLQCPSCPRGFSRNDALLRHLRVTHKSQTSAKRSVQQSCHRCVAKKLRCDRTQPCQSCGKSEARCVYPDRGVPEASRDAIPVHIAYDTGIDSKLKQVPVREESTEFTRPRPQDARAARDAGLFGSTIYPSPLPEQATPSTMENRSVSFDMLDDSIMAASLPAHRDSNFTHSGAPIPPIDSTETFLYGSSSQMFGSSEFGALNLDWLDFGTADTVNLTHDCTSNNFETQQIQSLQDLMPPWTHTNKLPTISPAAKDSQSSRLDEDEGRGRRSPQPSTEQWPFDQARKSRPQKCPRPLLHGALKESLAHDSSPGSSKLLIQLLSGPYLPPFSDLQDHAMVTALNSLKSYVDEFFAEFNPILPIIHAPSWRIESCPTVLLAAMTCIGAMFCADSPDAAIHSRVLSDICVHSLALLGHSDSASYHDLDFLSASCLHQIYSLGSGSRELYQSADRSRGMLIGSLRCMNLLGCLLMTEKNRQDPRGSTQSNEPSLQDDWMAWKEEELEIRLTWAAFEYDCTLCTLTNRRGAVELAELPSKLPCSETLWDAPSAQAWNALRSHVPAGRINALFRDALRDNMAGKVHTGLTSWGKRLCAQVIGRLLWDLKQLQIMSMSDFLGLTSLLSAQRQSKTALLDRLDKLTESMASPGSIADLINYNIARLICHYNHLCTTEEIMDLVVFLARNNAGAQSGNRTPDLNITRAKRRLESLLAVDLRQTRTLVWHAARIINIANQYVVSAPCEILRIFMGYAFILAVARYCPQASISLGEGVSVRLDQPSHDDQQKETISEWIQFGGPAAVGDATNFCTSEGIRVISQEAQKLLHKMRFWELSGKFATILGCLDETLR